MQTTFAQMRQSDPSIGTLFGEQKLWDDFPAEMAANDLSHRISTTIQRQRDEAMHRIGAGGAFSILTAPIRWLLTIGALLWFPLIQPILQRVLDGQIHPRLARDRDDHRAAARRDVPAAQRRVLRDLVRRVVDDPALGHAPPRESPDRAVDDIDLQSEFSLHGQVVRWIDDLLEPIKRQQRKRIPLPNASDSAKAARPSVVPPLPVGNPAAAAALAGTRMLHPAT